VRNPGCMLRQAVGGIEHHWKSSTQAISQISTLLRKGAIRGVRGETENGLTVLYPRDEERGDVA
jgi:ABC-type Na+ transport system ATPase subunit NatA